MRPARTLILGAAMAATLWAQQFQFKLEHLSSKASESFDVSLTEKLCLQSLNLDNTGVAARVQFKRVGRCLRATWV